VRQNWQPRRITGAVSACRWVRLPELRAVFGNQMIIRNIIRRRFGMPLLWAWLALVIGPAVALAQSGSAGGSIGNDENSLSGSRSEPSSDQAVPTPPSREAEQPRGSDAGGGSNFDGTWLTPALATIVGEWFWLLGCIWRSDHRQERRRHRSHQSGWGLLFDRCR
jgi:hypothetical protein